MGPAAQLGCGTVLLVVADHGRSGRPSSGGPPAEEENFHGCGVSNENG